GYLDEETAARIRERGPVLAVAASHPHMFGVQSAWADALGAPVLVCETDAHWLGRRPGRLELYRDAREGAPGLSLHRVGCHCAGSAIAHWAPGAGGRVVILCGDAVFPTPDRSWVGFLRSYPNKVPLSGAVAERIAGRPADSAFDRIVG